MGVSRIILTTGGTGGHIFPALAVAEELLRREPETQILFVGGTYGPEKRLAQEAGLAFAALPARGVTGRGLRGLGSIVWLGRSLVGARRIIRSFAPEVVVGFGGYAGFAPVLAASLAGVPSAVHEQNSFPGRANRLLARRADLTMISFADEQGLFPAGRTAHTGNPVRASIAALAGRGTNLPEGRAPRLLVAGGSQGARAVNTALIEALPMLSGAGVIIRHQSGAADLKRVRAAYLELGLDQEAVTAFISDMAEAYAWADLVICRAGATTIAELTVAGKPSLLIPFPHATHDHQSINASHLATKGAAIMVPESTLDALSLAEMILSLATDASRLAEMARAARSLGRPDAAARVADELEKLARAA